MRMQGTSPERSASYSVLREICRITAVSVTVRVGRSTGSGTPRLSAVAHRSGLSAPTTELSTILC